MKKRLAVAFTGPSNSGKTTLIVKVASILIDRFEKNVAIIKNDPKDKARFDVEGKDSFKFAQTGADVIVTSPTRTTLFSHKHQELDEMISLLGDFDILLVEGLKTLPLPRIAIFRKRLDPDYFEVSEALAIDETINKDEIPDTIPTLDLNDPDTVIEWILTHAKEV
ncbi:MAG: molybdopterin-guanine dinucleotide biosynthesis protein B [Thiovulaceae bacterium]|nr:molybdopterin-guanine dinucleotide biosynthesis protein B [Sulfurimonadaceae bacterium]